ncbi:MAG: hypothetical protein JXQ30_14170 [Spirochaetes bacterium]|nr:hypothetical protein [Spirochaetota bacterium]
MRAMIILLMTICLVTLLTGCATGKSTEKIPVYDVIVNSYRHPLSEGKNKVIIFPFDEKIGENDLEYQEYVKYLKKALVMRRAFAEEESGYHIYSDYAEEVLAQESFEIVDNIEEAEVAVFLLYGIGEPIESTKTITKPIFGITGTSSSTTTGIIHSYGDTHTLIGKTTYVPTFGVIGSRTVTETEIKNICYVYLVAYDVKKAIQEEELVQLWSTEFMSIGESGFLRRLFPMIMAAGALFIGTDTGYEEEKCIITKINEYDPRIHQIVSD